MNTKHRHWVVDWGLRLAVFVLIALVMGAILKRTASTVEGRTEPAGFALGLLHGAAMPGTWPCLIVGGDVPLYAANNTGRTYKLGYTLGVNLCGLLFFGLFFRRLQRLRESGWKPRSSCGHPDQEPTSSRVSR